MTQKELKRLVRVGAAKDITHSSSRAAIPEEYSQVGLFFRCVRMQRNAVPWSQRKAVCHLCKNYGYLGFRLKLRVSVWCACSFLLSTKTQKYEYTESMGCVYQGK